MYNNNLLMYKYEIIVFVGKYLIEYYYFNELYLERYICLNLEFNCLYMCV